MNNGLGVLNSLNWDQENFFLNYYKGDLPDSANQKLMIFAIICIVVIVIFTIIICRLVYKIEGSNFKVMSLFLCVDTKEINEIKNNLNSFCAFHLKSLQGISKSAENKCNYIKNTISLY